MAPGSIPTAWHLAQFNMSRPLAPLDSPLLAGFTSQLDAINALAEAAPGFVWRLTGDGNNATDVKVEGYADVIINLSVWTSADALFDFVYKTAHAKVMARRREWFDRIEVFQTLFWIPAGHTPSAVDALARLEVLRAHGPTADAFTFKQRFAPPGDLGPPINMRPEPYCVA